MLLASGAGSTRGITATAAYFEALTTPESLDFGWRYTQRFGSDAPTLNSLGESCYEGVLMLAALAREAQSLAPGSMCAVADSVSYDGPRGELHMRDRHVDQRVYLAEANAVEFDVIAQL
jgi:urea transport system substrate-binding protein